MNRAFLVLLFGGLFCLGAGAFELPPTWNLGTALVVSLGLMAGGVLLVIAGMTANIRMRTASAILAEGHRRKLESESVAAPLAPTGNTSTTMGEAPEAVVDMALFMEARNLQIREARPRATVLPLVFAALSGLFLLESGESFRRADDGSGVALGIVGVIGGMIAVLWALILYAPGFRTRPLHLRIDSRGIWLSKSRGSNPVVYWATPSLRLFLIDTRPSVRRRSSDGLPVLFLYERNLGEVPLSVLGMQALKVHARQRGLRVDELPQGSSGTLPLRKSMSLPFGSSVTVISRS